MSCSNGGWMLSPLLIIQHFTLLSRPKRLHHKCWSHDSRGWTYLSSFNDPTWLKTCLKLRVVFASSSVHQSSAIKFVGLFISPHHNGTLKADAALRCPLPPFNPPKSDKVKQLTVLRVMNRSQTFLRAAAHFLRFDGVPGSWVFCRCVLSSRFSLLFFVFLFLVEATL